MNICRRPIYAKIRSIYVKIHPIYAIIACGFLLIATQSCKDDETISRRYPCRFQFYVEQHATSIVFSACKSPGSYVFISTKIDEKGIRHVYAQSNNAKMPVEDNIISTDKEANYTAYLLGANNEIGLIVGCTNFSGLAAYDRICPNCPDLRPLVWSANGQKVQCNRCQRTYDLETGTLVNGAAGDALLRYGCNFDGTRLSVGN